MPMAIDIAGIEMRQFVASAAPTYPPIATAATERTNARQAIPCAAAMSSAWVRCAKGPRTLSGPNVTKNRVKISPGPIMAPQSRRPHRADEFRLMIASGADD
jgi:hypothetical protein